MLYLRKRLKEISPFNTLTIFEKRELLQLRLADNVTSCWTNKNIFSPRACYPWLDIDYSNIMILSQLFFLLSVLACSSTPRYHLGFLLFSLWILLPFSLACSGSVRLCSSAVFASYLSLLFLLLIFDFCCFLLSLRLLGRVLLPRPLVVSFSRLLSSALRLRHVLRLFSFAFVSSSSCCFLSLLAVFASYLQFPLFSPFVASSFWSRPSPTTCSPFLFSFALVASSILFSRSCFRYPSRLTSACIVACYSCSCPPFLSLLFVLFLPVAPLPLSLIFPCRIQEQNDNIEKPKIAPSLQNFTTKLLISIQWNPTECLACLRSMPNILLNSVKYETRVSRH